MRPCSSLDSHTWSQGSNFVLSLPGADGWMEVVRSWRCLQCGMETCATGALDRTTGPLSPVAWNAQADEQQTGSNPYGQVSKAEKAWEQKRRALLKRLKRR